MARQRRMFSPQFRAKAVQLVIEMGRPVEEVARELEINEGTLGNWLNLWKSDYAQPETALTKVERARVAAMKEEIRKLRMENEMRCQVASGGRTGRLSVLATEASRPSHRPIPWQEFEIETRAMTMVKVSRIGGL